MQMEGRRRSSWRQSERGGEKRGSSRGKDQKGQMNDSKMMRETRGEIRGSRKSKMLAMFLSPNRAFAIELIRSNQRENISSEARFNIHSGILILTGL